MNEIAFLDLNEISLQSLSPMLSMMVFALFILIVGAIKKDLSRKFLLRILHYRYICKFRHYT